MEGKRRKEKINEGGNERMKEIRWKGEWKEGRKESVDKLMF